MGSLRLKRLTAKSCASSALALALFGLTAVTTPARAGDDDAAPDIQFLRGILKSLGLKSGDEASINYEERPPLVIPSDHNLPPPQKTDATASNPAWPKDPDIARAKREKELRSQGTSSDEVDRESRPLSPAELTPGAKYAPHVRRYGNVANPSVGPDGTERLSPSQLGYRGGLFSKIFGKDDGESASFTGEPPRAVLTDPPPGYQTPSADQPYGKLEQKAAPKAEDYYTTHVEGQK